MTVWACAPAMRAALQAKMKAKSGFYLDAEGLESRRQDGYVTVDAPATLYLEERGLEFSVRGRNLSDKDVTVSGYGFIGYNTFRSAPRLYGVSVKTAF